MCVIIYEIYDLLPCLVLYFYFNVNLCFSTILIQRHYYFFIWVCSKYSYHMWLDMRAINPFEYCGLDLFRCCFSAWFHSGVPISLYSFIWFPHDMIVRVMILCWYKIKKKKKIVCFVKSNGQLMLWVKLSKQKSIDFIKFKL